MGQDPGQIRQDIAQTRTEMGDTVEALGHKTDVSGRVKEAVSGKVQTARSRVAGTTPDGGEMKQGAKQAAGVAKENPLGLAIGALAAGFIAGLVVPSTKLEDEQLGPLADEVKEKAKETGQEAMQRGKEVAGQAAETAKEAGRQQADELKQSAQEKAQQTRVG